jgi:hypothetical protein
LSAFAEVKATFVPIMSSNWPNCFSSLHYSQIYGIHELSGLEDIRLGGLAYQQCHWSGEALAIADFSSRVFFRDWQKRNLNLQSTIYDLQSKIMLT